MKCLEAGMNDLAGEEKGQRLAITIATVLAVIVLNMLPQRLKK